MNPFYVMLLVLDVMLLALLVLHHLIENGDVSSPEHTVNKLPIQVGRLKRTI